MKHKYIAEDFKIRLDKYLAKHFKDISRSRIQRGIESGLVEVNGQIIKESNFVVRKGDVIKFQISNFKFQKDKLKATNTSLKVLYDNHGLLIIDKPAGLVVHPGAGFKGETLASALLYQFANIHLVGEEHRPGIVHRLDKDTSGVILIAKTQEMYEYLKNAFAERRIKKEYIALVKGRIGKPHGFIDTPIGKSKTDFRKQATKNVIVPKDALTEYWVLEYLPATTDVVSPFMGSIRTADKSANYRARESLDEYTLLRVKLHTGRTHQIRVHFLSLGHPLMGDKLYGGKKSVLEGLHRQFLHAKKIEVQLPASPDGSQGGPDRTWIEAESELAEDLKKVLEKLGSKII